MINRSSDSPDDSSDSQAKKGSRLAILASGVAVLGVLGTILGIANGGFNLMDRLRPPVTATDYEVYKPFNVDGESLRVKVSSTVLGGACMSPSDFVDRENAQNAWRCTADQSLLDPCFSSPSLPPAQFVACSLDGPTNPVIKLQLNQSLPVSSTGQLSDSDLARNSQPWYLVLTDGIDCRRVTPVQNANGDPQTTYTCKNNSEGFGQIDRSNKLWKVLVRRSNSTSAEATPIRKAYF